MEQHFPEVSEKRTTSQVKPKIFRNFIPGISVFRIDQGLSGNVSRKCPAVPFVTVSKLTEVLAECKGLTVCCVVLCSKEPALSRNVRLPLHLEV